MGSSLRFELCQGRTVLVAARAELPLHFQRPLRDQRHGCTLALLTPAGALFQGDGIDLDVECGVGSRVTLVTPAATKLNRCDSGPIKVAMHVRVGAGATFRYLPSELIPLAGVRYEQRLEVSLAEAASATLVEVVTPGLSATPFRYNRLVLSTQVRDPLGLIVLDRATLEPASPLGLGNATHYGSALVLGPGTPSERADQVHDCLARLGFTGRGSASTLRRGGIAVKVLGGSAHEVRRALLQAIGDPQQVE